MSFTQLPFSKQALLKVLKEKGIEDISTLSNEHLVSVFALACKVDADFILSQKDKMHDELYSKLT